MLAHQLGEGWVPTTPRDQALVQQQLEKLLATSHFSSSRRYPSFLRFVVNNALSGQTELLKERILGVEIFGRHADYDTATDPIVRVTAAEIRKRIEQYYQSAGHDDEIRISLPPGSYVPQFFLPGKRNGHAAEQALPPVVPAPAKPTETGETQISSLPAEQSRIPFRLILVATVAAVLAGAGYFTWRSLHPTVVKTFWAPFVASNEPVLFCIADQNQYSTIKLRDAADPQQEITLTDTLTTVVIDDVGPLINIAGLLRAYGKTYRVQAEANTSLTDLRRQPSVFIGAFDNGWTLRLTSPLRYHFANDTEMKRFWIEDRERPGKSQRTLVRDVQQRTGTYKDYAIVARFVDPNTDQYALVVAGIARGGTVAAGEFLVDSSRMNEMLNYIPKGWDRKNVEIVLETQVIEGRSGPPRIDAVHVW
jgi:hypothetical protein